jgi:hypothetical protein
MKKIILFFFLLPVHFLLAQQPVKQNSSGTLAPLTVEKIMHDPKWIGTSPSDIFWSPDGDKLYFEWNPEKATSDSLYFITLKDHHPQKVDPSEREWAQAKRQGVWNNDRSRLAFTKGQTLYLLNVVRGQLIPIIQTTHEIINIQFGFHDSAVIFQQQSDLYAWNIKTGATEQLTDFVAGEKEEAPGKKDKQEEFLEKDALQNSQVLRQRKEERE